MKSKLDLIVSQIVELSTKEKSDDPVRNLYSIMIVIDNRIESIMKDMREIERGNYDNINSKSNDGSI